jgi:siroheme synthase-like protein
MFPLVVDLVNRRVIVVGAGKVGAHKARQLLEAGAQVTVITDQVVGDLPEGIVETILRPYRGGDLLGAFLVVSATGDPTTNDQISQEARERNIWLNVVDDPQRSDFYFTAVHRDGDVSVSVSTEGSSPALAQWIRDAIRVALPKNLAEVARRLRAERHSVHKNGETTEDRDWTSRVESLINEVTRSSS